MIEQMQLSLESYNICIELIQFSSHHVDMLFSPVPSTKRNSGDISGEYGQLYRHWVKSEGARKIDSIMEAYNFGHN